MSDLMKQLESGNSFVLESGMLSPLTSCIERATGAQYERCHVLSYLDSLRTCHVYCYFTDFSLSLYVDLGEDKRTFKQVKVCLDSESRDLKDLWVLTPRKGTTENSTRVALDTLEVFECFMELWVKKNPMRDLEQTLRYCKDPKILHAIKTLNGVKKYIENL